MLINANVFIDAVQSIPEKPMSSMADLLNSLWEHPGRIHDRDVKKVSKVTSIPTIKNLSRSPTAVPSDSYPDSSHKAIWKKFVCKKEDILRKN